MRIRSRAPVVVVAIIILVLSLMNVSSLVGPARAIIIVVTIAALEIIKSSPQPFR